MNEPPVIVGHISGLFGVNGWVKVFSFTEPRKNILSYLPWRLHLGNAGGNGVEYKVVEGRVHGKGLVARLDGVDDRDAAAQLVGAEIRVGREMFDAPDRDQYYWADLVGMQVQTVDGQALGTVDRVLATGANDVLIVEGERRRLVPFLVEEVVKRVDLGARTIVVEWDPEF